MGEGGRRGWGTVGRSCHGDQQAEDLGGAPLERLADAFGALDTLNALGALGAGGGGGSVDSVVVEEGGVGEVGLLEAMGVLEGVRETGAVAGGVEGGAPSAGFQNPTVAGAAAAAAAAAPPPPPPGSAAVEAERSRSVRADPGEEGGGEGGLTKIPGSRSSRMREDKDRAARHAPSLSDSQLGQLHGRCVREHLWVCAYK